MSHSDTGRSAAERFEANLLPILDLAYGMARRLTLHEDDAQDLVHEAVLQAFQAFDHFEAGSNFKAWFLRILTNQFYARHRRATRQVDTVSLEDAPELYLYGRTSAAGLHSWSEDPARVFMSRLAEAEIHAAFASLPDEFRVICLLYFMEELSYQEMADILDCPVGTVRSRLHRGRKLLQKALWHLAEERGIVTHLKRDPGGG